MRIVSLASIAAVTLLGSACSRSDEEARPTADVPMRIARSADTSGGPESLASGDIRIENENRGVDLALIGDTISSGLSRSALETARRETNPAAVTGSGFGADIEKMVKGTVQGALSTRVSFPLSSVNDARYENGAIVFDWNGRPPSMFKQVNINDKPLLESFSEADAQRFVEAVRARKREMSQQR